MVQNRMLTQCGAILIGPLSKETRLSLHEYEEGEYEGEKDLIKQPGRREVYTTWHLVGRDILLCFLSEVPVTNGAEHEH